MWRAALLVGVVVTSACGAYGGTSSTPGEPNACRWEGNKCDRSSECCSGWCVNRVCERKMATRREDPRAGERIVQ